MRLDGALDLGLELAHDDGACEELSLVHDGGGRFRDFLARVVFEGRVDDDERGVRAVAVDGGRVALEAESARKYHLAVVVETVFFLAAEGQVLKCHAVGRTRGVHAHVEAVDLDVFQEQGTDIFGKAHVDAVDARAVVGLDLHVGDVSLYGGVEAYADGAGVLLSRAEGEVADGVTLPCVGAVARVDDRLREVGVLESGNVVLKLDDGAAHAFALEDGAAVVLFGLAVGRGPGEGGRNLVDAVGQVDDEVAVGVVVERSLDSLRVVFLAVALRIVGISLDVYDFGTHGKLDLGERAEGKSAENG